MNKIDKIEILLILILITCSWFVDYFPGNIFLGNLFLIGSVTILVQSLVRDLAILFVQRKSEKQIGEKKQCMCVESILGVSGVAIGLLLLGMGSSRIIVMSHLMWIVGICTVLLVGFLLKDYVLQWNPFRIRKEKNHLNVIVVWKK